ncbi:MAG: carbamoyltransferase HypF [Deltaproteobacteria bacterium]|nr:carbamoyltransferase HypF [Deltaproteobacteria bacterium]
MKKRARGIIQGIVQGVGFRPFIYQLARRYGLSGYVTNTPYGVDLEVEGNEADLERFFRTVQSDPPPLAHIASVAWEPMPLGRSETFRIIESVQGPERNTLISPDVATCPDCLRELRDPSDRRFAYPFINCTNCGPRYTIITDIPYDRPATTMRRFTMCPACRSEYEDPGDRRFHAQPNACWDCGPRLFLHDAKGALLASHDPLGQAVSLLSRGRILAIKGLGGFHLAVDAADHRAVVRLRRRKHREEKPLAVMVRDLPTARELAHVDDEEARALTSIQRPIVLLRKRRRHGLSPQVAPRNRFVGIMLPYTPLHHLLMEGPYRALVMTSGNRTEEPINIRNEEAFDNLRGIADYFLVHDRDIHLRSDDSVVRVVGGVTRQIRRSRGYVPVPVFLPEQWKDLPRVLAVGGELKNTVCLTRRNEAFLSQHIGDLENLETEEFLRLTVSHLERILEIKPSLVAHDLHPDYLSTRYALERSSSATTAVQHHHAHVVSCMAEHGLEGPVIGLAFDGTGYGSDGKVWGCEFLLADLVSFRRRGHLEYVPLPGGDAASRSPWRMALVYLYHVFEEDLFDLPIRFVQRLDRRKARVILQMARGGFNAPLTSSCGRLFDAVAALLGIRDEIAYEGQAAVELEMCQSPRENGAYGWEIAEEAGMMIIRVRETLRGIVGDLMRGVSKGIISRRFHNTCVRLCAAACERIREQEGLSTVVLSGGSFQNVTLLLGLTRALEQRGFSVHSHRLVPANDGGLALGQAVCAGWRHAGRKGAFEKRRST